jgi:hypothetical protein
MHLEFTKAVVHIIDPLRQNYIRDPMFSETLFNVRLFIFKTFSP